ncbi:DUF2269 family protein [Stutzerimonas kirkiae]|uniref:DUF2269 domain-containing protein n=1 Tax=Stutzerimonas kirkiae TaxID=2211392 RepID=A0A4Q9RD56_9GAMM|nr:DUF2269 family protein [Stutzerimonas kirkiae]TBU99272.1 DUF2269 domain-containing protein [Stutzerimonas kirkiae]TBV06268.1 DUF2269 domain-containing protein [Stutzerimonas kirkiae]TBV08012.1 DUF2269 domain-containing protein [Stutzerimonas kirkiae]TBV15840.1 DUF2269 domain-containing protein [Stutzerimonas kirkiae]
MEYYLAIRIFHGAAGVLLVLGVFAHILMFWKAARRGEPELLQRRLRRTRLASLPAMTLVALALPFSGWWMAHLANWPLGQLWLLLSNLLFVLLIPLVLLLAGRLSAWEALGNGAVPAQLPRTAAVYGVLILLLLLAIMGLMGAKPL